MLKKLGISAALLIGSLAVAMAAGLFAGYPLVGDTAGTTCLSTGNNNVCNQFRPAGPSIITGLEQIPADTGSGTQPTTVLIPPAALGAGPYVYNAPLTGASITLTNLQRRLVLEPAGTIAALTVVTPAASTLIDGQLLGICSTQIVTALTLTEGTGTTMLGKATALAVPATTGGASCPEWIYRQSNTTWYRTQ